MAIRLSKLSPITPTGVQAPDAGCLGHDDKQTNWCWAACVAMALRRKGIAMDQCKIVEEYLKPLSGPAPKCCSGASCNEPCELDKKAGKDLIDIFRIRGFAQVDLVRNPLEPEDLSKILKDGPVAILWEGGRGVPNHIILVVRFEEQSDVVTICDPVPARLEGYLSYSELKSCCGSGSQREWTFTWGPLN